MERERFQSMRRMSFSELSDLYENDIKPFFWGTDLRKGASVSVFAHASVAAAIFISTLSFSLSEDKPEEPERIRLTSFEISAPITDAEERNPIPKIAPPAAKEDAIGDPQDLPVEEVAFNEGGTGDNMTVWTPPPPVYGNKAGQLDQIQGEKVENPSPIKFIDMEKKGTDPVLVSYSQGTFGGAREIGEAMRLSGEGRLTMQVMIDIAGKPIGCSVVETSGSNVLDDLGCGVVMNYLYEPGLDESRNPIESSIYEVLEWSRNNIPPSDQNGFGRIDPRLDENKGGDAESSLN